MSYGGEKVKDNEKKKTPLPSAFKDVIIYYS